MTGSILLLTAGLIVTATRSDGVESRHRPERDQRAPIAYAQATLAAPAAPAYGYQPYNDRNPTGFYHPSGMGYGSYHMTPKYHGHRMPALEYRKFRGN